MNLHRQLGAYDPNYGYHFVPEIKARVEHRGGGYLLRTNKDGFRSEHDFRAPKQPDRFRILVFGDSFTAGDGVSNGSRYSDVLERALPGSEVFNFGLPGTGTDEQYLVFEHAARDIPRDLVVIGIWVENIRRLAARFRPGLQSTSGELVWMPKAYFTLGDDGRLERHNDPVPRDALNSDELDPEERQRMLRITGLRATRHVPQPVRKVVQRVTRYDVLPEYQSADNPAWQLMRAILDQWISALDVPVIVMPIPLARHVLETASAEHYQARFRELESLPRVVVHDPLPDILRRPLQERATFRFSSDDDHPTRAYHQVLGESLAAAVSHMRLDAVA